MTLTLPNKIPADDNLFDDTPGYDEETGVKLAPNLTDTERKQANLYYHVFNGLWGLCLVRGDPGAGKDTFGNYLSYTLKRFFPWKRVLRDQKPRKLFGTYAGQFDESVIYSDLQRIKEVAKGVGATKIDAVMEKAADDWATSKGVVLLKNSILYITEYWNWCYNRDPHKPINKTMGAIHKLKRHFDTLIIGTIQLPSELDKKTCLPFVDWLVTCVKSRNVLGRFTFLVEKVKYDWRLDMLTPVSQPFPITVDAAKPRSFMGDGKIVLSKPKYNPETEEERVVLEALKLGAEKYEDLIELLITEGDMSEYETLATLKELKFNRRKRVVDYPCYWGLYNSKNAVEIRSSVRAGD